MYKAILFWTLKQILVSMAYSQADSNVVAKVW